MKVPRKPVAPVKKILPGRGFSDFGLIASSSGRKLSISVRIKVSISFSMLEPPLRTSSASVLGESLTPGTDSGFSETWNRFETAEMRDTAPVESIPTRLNIKYFPLNASPSLKTLTARMLISLAVVSSSEISSPVLRSSTSQPELRAPSHQSSRLQPLAIPSQQTKQKLWLVLVPEPVFG